MSISSVGVGVITLASHARGRGFDSHTEYDFAFFAGGEFFHFLI